MTTEKEPTWLELLMNGTSEAESPKSFFYWSGLSAISAVVKSNVYLDKYLYKLYPNLYCLLIAKSGLRKGVPVGLAKALVSAVGNTRVISGRNSIQGVIKDLSNAYTKPTGGPPIIDACGFLVSGELSTFLVEDPQALTILTDLYDGHYNPEWRNTLKGSPQETLKNVSLTLLGASAPVHFHEFLPSNAVSGGFIARTLIVVESKASGINSLMGRPTKEVPMDKLVKHLTDLSNLKGEFQKSVGATKVYDEWYKEYRAQDHSHDKTGFSERYHDHILKVAMLLSLSRGTSLVLEEEDILEALERCQIFMPNVTKISTGTGKAQLQNQMKLVWTELQEKGADGQLRSKLLKKFYGEMEALELDRVVNTLQQAGALEVKDVGGDLLYTLKPEAIALYKRKVQGGQV